MSFCEEVGTISEVTNLIGNSLEILMFAFVSHTPHMTVCLRIAYTTDDKEAQVSLFVLDNATGN